MEGTELSKLKGHKRGHKAVVARIQAAAEDEISKHDSEEDPVSLEQTIQNWGNALEKLGGSSIDSGHFSGRYWGLFLCQFWGSFLGCYSIGDIKWPENWAKFLNLEVYTTTVSNVISGHVWGHFSGRFLGEKQSIELPRSSTRTFKS